MCQNDLIRIPNSDRNDLKTDFANTGKTVLELFHEQNPTNGIDWVELYQFLRDSKKSLAKGHFLYLKQLLQENKTLEYQNSHVELTDELQTRIRKEIERTEMSPKALIAKLKKNGITPPKLKVQAVHS